MLKKVLSIYFLFILFHSCSTKEESKIIQSPNGDLVLNFKLNKGVPYYNLSFKDKKIIENSKLGFLIEGAKDLASDFTITKTETSSIDTIWEQVWGEERYVKEKYNLLEITLQEKQDLKRIIQLVFKVFNDGIGFRYEIPEQESLKEFKITDELTEFNLVPNFDAWWIPAYGEQVDHEYLFQKNKITDLKEPVHTPLTMSLDDSLFVSIHEAALVNYAGMTLKPNGSTHLKCDLVPWSTGEKVRAKTPLVTPWRTIQVAETAGDLITSNLLLNLNEPNELEDVSWISPGKYNGIWWEMHLDLKTWNLGPKHGANTENVLKHIDFASKNNISAVLVEGWNTGWDKDWSLGEFSFTKAYPDYDLDKISKYAKERNVGIIAHHETGGNVHNYESQMDSAYSLCRKYGIHHLKTGYVNKNPKEHFQGQFMVNHYNKVMQKTAKSQIMLDMHEPVKATGLRRTYPNMMTREGVRGMEYNAWSSGNPPSHTVILPFTRCLAGPVDYTPGILDVSLKSRKENRVHTTIAKQLALYVVLYSPLHMVPDLIENYEGHPAFQFIKDVPTDWETTKVLNASIGEYVTIVRKNRNGTDWFIGCITNEKARELTINLNFLDAGKKYIAEIYADGEDADYKTNPTPINIVKKQVNSNDKLILKLVPGGGQAIRFLPKN